MASECRSCRQEIDWAVKHPEEINPRTGKPCTMPINHDSADVPGGNLIVWYDGDGLLRYRSLKTGETPGPSEHLGKSHYATCPQADQWRTRRGDHQ